MIFVIEIKECGKKFLESQGTNSHQSLCEFLYPRITESFGLEKIFKNIKSNHCNYFIHCFKSFLNNEKNSNVGLLTVPNIKSPYFSSSIITTLLFKIKVFLQRST